MKLCTDGNFSPKHKQKAGSFKDWLNIVWDITQNLERKAFILGQPWRYLEKANLIDKFLLHRQEKLHPDAIHCI